MPAGSLPDRPAAAARRARLRLPICRPRWQEQASPPTARASLPMVPAFLPMEPEFPLKAAEFLPKAAAPRLTKQALLPAVVAFLPKGQAPLEAEFQPRAEARQAQAFAAMVSEEALAFPPTAMVLAPGSEQRVAPQARAAFRSRAQEKEPLEASQPRAQEQVPLEAASQPMALGQAPLEAASQQRAPARVPQPEPLPVSSRVQRRQRSAEAAGCRSWCAGRQ
jgi:hypothetical protein